MGNLILYRPEGEESLTFQVESSRLLPKTALQRRVNPEPKSVKID
jgi:hypothetical protein